MNTIYEQLTTSTTALRLPTSLLQTIDKWCGENDITRSQFLRRCISDRIQSLGLQLPTASPDRPEQQTWSPELYERIRRRT
jgi:hypothetical protein